MNEDQVRIMIIFGASGDLTARKLMPALYKLETKRLLPEKFTIIGYARREFTTEEFKNKIEKGIKENTPTDEFNEEICTKFLNRLHYVSGQYNDVNGLNSLYGYINKFVEGEAHSGVLLYMSVPPGTVDDILETFKRSELYNNRTRFDYRIIVEKPFGVDLESAQRLNQLLDSIFDEKSIYRIDHYLAKDTVQNILVFRFGNTIFEPIWNREYIDNIQITASETIGIEGRGRFYEQTGVVRDMIQNHVLQVLSLIAMEVPIAGDAENIRDKKCEVFRSIAPIGTNDFAFGQYEGYREEEDVASHSLTPTFVAVKLYINNWRWFGVPFYIRSGKRLARKLTDVIIQFRKIPLCVLSSDQVCRQIQPNRLVIRIQPDEGFRLIVSTKTPGKEDQIFPANLDFRYTQAGLKMTDPYERILLDGINGRAVLFWRADSIEWAWKVVSPLLEAEAKLTDIPIYKPGTWGPKQAETLLSRDGHYWLESY